MDLPLPLCGFRSFCTMAAERGSELVYFRPKGKQYSFVTWYIARKGPSDHKCELNLLLASTFWSNQSTFTAICWWCRNAPLPIESMPRAVWNCSLAHDATTRSTASASVDSSTCRMASTAASQLDVLHTTVVDLQLLRFHHWLLWQLLFQYCLWESPLC